MLIVSLALLATLINAVIDAKKILLLPPNVPSHILELATVGEQLVKNGHTVYMVLKSVTKPPLIVTTSGISFIYYESSNAVDPFHDTMFRKRSTDAYMTSSLIAKIKFITQFSERQCDDILSKQSLYAEIANRRVDFAIVGASVVTNCLFVIPHRLRIPYSGITAVPMPYVSNIMLLPSIAPIRHSQLHDDMNLLQRVKNTLMTATGLTIFNFFTDDKRYLKYTPERPYESLEDLASKSKMWLIDLDNILDYPKIKMPNVFYVGGLLTHPARKLPNDLAEFADGATDGLIIVSFGTTISHMPVDVLQKIADAFKNLRQRVIWKHLGSMENVTLPDNVFVRAWIPQNDLLGHPNTKLFITHCGNNGQYEALYHGVPMIGFPMTAEQPFNAERMEHKKFGVKMDIQRFSSYELYSNIETVVYGDVNRQAIRRASAIFKDRRVSPREEAAYWVEHVMKHGSDHLSMPASNLSWYQILLLDVFTVILASIVVLFLGFYALVKLCLRSFRGAKSLKPNRK
ncbi:UDP-glucuronosyltransferase 2B17-like [Tubulanus polymorphus]|uniref:UDP-glucuronosyltransferase 2B17-like n=1 Tax=Tubulanus polymorphus TaxID=672921 RepID=UPI003DA43DE5